MNNDRRKEIEKLSADIIAFREALNEVAAEWAGKLGDLRDQCETIRDDEQEYYDNMPESFQNGEKGDAASEAISALEDAHGVLDEAASTLDDLGGDDFLQEALDSLDNAKGG